MSSAEWQMTGSYEPEDVHAQKQIAGLAARILLDQASRPTGPLPSFESLQQLPQLLPSRKSPSPSQLSSAGLPDPQLTPERSGSWTPSTMSPGGWPSAAPATSQPYLPGVSSPSLASSSPRPRSWSTSSSSILAPFPRQGTSSSTPTSSSSSSSSSLTSTSTSATPPPSSSFPSASNAPPSSTSSASASSSSSSFSSPSASSSPFSRSSSPSSSSSSSSSNQQQQQQQQQPSENVFAFFSQTSSPPRSLDRVLLRPFDSLDRTGQHQHHQQQQLDDLQASRRAGGSLSASSLRGSIGSGSPSDRSPLHHPHGSFDGSSLPSASLLSPRFSSFPSSAPSSSSSSSPFGGPAGTTLPAIGGYPSSSSPSSPTSSSSSSSSSSASGSSSSSFSAFGEHPMSAGRVSAAETSLLSRYRELDRHQMSRQYLAQDLRLGSSGLMRPSRHQSVDGNELRNLDLLMGLSSRQAADPWGAAAHLRSPGQQHGSPGMALSSSSPSLLPSASPSSLSHTHPGLVVPASVPSAAAALVNRISSQHRAYHYEPSGVDSCSTIAGRQNQALALLNPTRALLYGSSKTECTPLTFLPGLVDGKQKFIPSNGTLELGDQRRLIIVFVGVRRVGSVAAIATSPIIRCDSISVRGISEQLPKFCRKKSNIRGGPNRTQKKVLEEGRILYAGTRVTSTFWWLEPCGDHLAHPPKPPPLDYLAPPFPDQPPVDYWYKLCLFVGAVDVILRCTFAETVTSEQERYWYFDLMLTKSTQHNAIPADFPRVTPKTLLGSPTSAAQAKRVREDQDELPSAIKHPRGD